MIHSEVQWTSSIYTGYLVAHRARGFSVRTGSIRVPGMGHAPCYRVRANEKTWGSYRPKGMREWQMIYTLKGEGWFTNDGHVFRPGPDVAVLQPAGMPQHYGLGDRSNLWEHVWVGFIPRQMLMPLLKWPQVIPGVLALELGKGKQRDVLRKAVLNVHALFHSWQSNRELRAFNEFERFLFDCFDVAQPVDNRLDERVEAALQYISQEFSKDLRPARVAVHCGLSLSRMEHLVKQETGVPIRVHIENLRMRHARHLLEFTKQTVSEVAYAVGFTSLKQFCTRFKVLEHMSPGSYRAMRNHGSHLNVPPT